MRDRGEGMRLIKIIFSAALIFGAVQLPLARAQTGDDPGPSNTNNTNPIEGLFRGLGSIFQPATSSGKQQSQPNTESANPIEGLIRGIGGAIESAISPKHGEFKGLVNQKKYMEAAAYYSKEREFFDKNRSRYKEDFQIIASAINSEFSPRLAAANSQINRAIGIVSDRATTEAKMASELALVVVTVEKDLKSYDAIELLRAPELRSEGAVSLEKHLSQAQKLIADLSPKAFASFDHFQGRSFFQDIPVTNVSKSQFLVENIPLIEGQLSQQNSKALEVFLDTYQSDLGGVEKRKIARFQMDAVRRESAGESPLTIALKSRELSRKYGVDSEAVPLQIIELTLDTQEKDEIKLDLTNDSGFKLVKSSLVEGASLVEMPDAPLTIFVQVASSESNRKVLSRRDVSSRFESGTRSLPNPEYDVARHKYLQEESSHRQNQLRNSLSAPAQNWGQALGRALGEAGTAISRDKALEVLRATPITINETVYTPYTFRVSEVEVNKVIKVVVTTFDPTSRRYWKTERDFSESRKFEMAFNVHAQDENRYANSSKYVNESDLARFESQPVKWAVSELVDVVKGGEGSAINFSSASSVLGSMAQPAFSPSPGYRPREVTAQQLIEDDPRSESVVVVLSPKGGLGSGFFVDTGLIITNYHVVEGANFSEVKLKSGKVTYGKVLRTDIGRDLALIRVSEPGLPVKFSEDRLVAGQQVEAIGDPKGLQFSLTRGVVSAVRKRAVPEIGEVMFIQTDTPISPGNSGGPLFAKDRVIGINTMKFAAKGVEGLSFAVHVSEVKFFLNAK